MHALVIGANRGIGAALREALLARGETVTGTRREAPGEGWIALDVTDPEAVSDLGRAVDAPLDLLVCNAGIYPDKGQSLATGYPPGMWRDAFATNVTGVFLTIQALLPQLRAARGKIAIVSSQMAGSREAPGGSYVYRASKAAVLNLGRNLAVDLRGDRIAVGIYHPGWVATDMGGPSAAITPAAAAAGLLARFDELTLGTTGGFRAWDGQTLPF